jgi:membrane protein required for colicin V production
MTITLFDTVILTIVSISSLLGLYKGIIKITINTLGFITSIFTTIFLYPKVKIIFASYFNNDTIVSITSCVTAYVFSLIVLTFICSSLIIAVSVITQGFFDRLLGAIAGFIRGILISVILFCLAAIFATDPYSKADSAESLVFNLSQDDYPEWLKTSITTSYLQSLLQDIVKLTPVKILNHFAPLFRSEKNINKNLITDEIKQNFNTELDHDTKELLPIKNK